MKGKAALLCAWLAAFLLACSSTPGISLLRKPSPTATPSPSPTLTPTPIPTPTPTPTPTPIPAARVESGEEALRNGDWEQAVYEFQTAQQATTDAGVQAAALLGLGRTRLASGNYYEAIQVLSSLIEGFPQSLLLPEAHFLLGQAYAASEQFGKAADEYLNYLTLRPGVIDGYVLDLRGDALFAAGDYASAGRDYQAALQTPGMLDTTLLDMKQARSLALSGDSTSALALYDQIFARAPDDSTRALILLRKGQVYTNLGQTEAARSVFLDAVNNYPTAYESYSALLALVEAGFPVDELNRGLVDFFAGEYGMAQAAFDRYLQKSPPDPATALYYYGLALRANGGYQAATGLWDQIINGYPDHPLWDDAIEQKAYTQWAYLDQYTLATQTLLDFVTRVPGHPRAGEFLFDAAQVAERSGELKRSAELWQRVANEYPAYEQAQRAQFLAAISLYRAGDYPGAQAAFQRNIALTLSLYDRAAAYFWIGKSQAAEGDTTGARASWEQAASVDPTGYYSERALDILRGSQPFTPPQDYDLAYDEVAERSKAEAWLKSVMGLPEETDLSGLGAIADDPRLHRGAELWNLGLYNEARIEFESLRQSVSGDAILTYRLANYFSGLGLFRSATLAARQVLNLAGMDDAGTLNAPIYFNRLRFGLAFSDLVIPAAQEYGFHPLFLFSVIRQESLFESFVRSSAAASGLMQIIPATGAEIAANLGWPPDYTDADLYRPVVNIRFGADYLAQQVRTFDGEIYPALAAYNGGPGNSNEWRKLSQGDPDLFLEVIRFSETRNYIRGIYEIFSIYRRLYDRSP